MSLGTKKLLNYIDSFQNNDIGGLVFERLFSDCYDFEEIEVGPYTEYFDKIRALLERFSPYENDLKEHSTYYISEKQLRAEISNLRR